ncbi:MAG: hypothetical protein U5L10_04535 [Candidatus Moranbacteria bacterium]|nr:hypothetical protein [Candidatus Moranbacteria bacterium]
MKPFLIFPYHDPQKKFNYHLNKNIGLLKEIFSEILVSATFPTIKDNQEGINFLKKNGCIVFKNDENTQIGDHFRSGLQLFLDRPKDGYAYFGFIDRIIFDLESKHKESFIKDISEETSKDLVIFARSKKAWDTHPKDYYLIEKIIGDTGKILFDKDFDWVWCGIKLNKSTAKTILEKSTSKDFSVMPEFVLVSLFNKLKLENKEVEWQEWEGFFWSKIQNKRTTKALSKKEKIFRLGYVNNSIHLFLNS